MEEQPECHYEVIVEGSYSFLHDVTCAIKKPIKSPYRSATIKQFWTTLKRCNQFHYTFAYYKFYLVYPTLTNLRYICTILLVIPRVVTFRRASKTECHYFICRPIRVIPFSHPKICLIFTRNSLSIGNRSALWMWMCGRNGCTLIALTLFWSTTCLFPNIFICRTPVEDIRTFSVGRRLHLWVFCWRSRVRSFCSKITVILSCCISKSYINSSQFS